MVCLFHLYSDDPDGPARCWATVGLLLRMAQSVNHNRICITMRSSVSLGWTSYAAFSSAEQGILNGFLQIERIRSLRMIPNNSRGAHGCGGRLRSLIGSKVFSMEGHQGLQRRE